jgi:hypothetical protein
VEPTKVILRYANGKILKGFTQDFLPNKDRFHLHLSDNASGEALEVLVKELKAIFFVQDFAGDLQYKERKKYTEGEKPSGKRVEVTFKDGEVMVGSTLGYDPSRPGFFTLLLHKDPVELAECLHKEPVYSLLMIPFKSHL